MKKFLQIIFIFLISINTSFADNSIKGGIEYYWTTTTQNERDEKIVDVRNSLFSNSVIEEYSNLNLKEKFKNRLYDENRDLHLLLVKNGKLKQDKEILAGFYAFGKILAVYAVTYLNEPHYAYYYDLFGNLLYVDYSVKPYPEYPTEIYQFKITNSKLVAATYSPQENEQYMYDAKKKFLGVWYKKNLYNKKGKVVMTREI